ncbi:PucR family transcriptional regulator [Pseudonocardia acidicola]|uniref:Transcriptional regulator n=1 Tax=Pseudonocardia acidicola TaxID=2724939 RepID=A0ABX1SF54_9PSEU|nr:helix-turn-helix domain-containing protein [Pseudonocardia acidicola]NMH99162.1 transcriptional regulator [Pseudonocardia acidicola]
MSTTNPSGSSDTAAAREQLAQLRSLLALSMVLAEDHGDEGILRIAISAVGSLGRVEVHASYLVRDGRLVASSVTSDASDPGLDAQVEMLAGSGGRVTVPGRSWGWAYPLASMSGLRGYLVVCADAEPSADEQLLVTVLAQQAGAALAAACLRRREREQTEELRSLTEKLGSAVSELEERTRIHEALTRGVSAPDSEVGLARAVHQLTGLPVAVEDTFGNLRAWAGPEEPTPYPKAPGRIRSESLRRAQQEGRPVRVKDRIVALAQPGSEVLGVIALIDPDGTATPAQILALEHAAVALGTELTHQRHLAEVELRLRRDLIDDLLSGVVTKDEGRGALARARALGHDLHTPHRVVVIQALDGRDADQALVRAAERAAATLGMECLLTTRARTVVLVAQRPLHLVDPAPWPELHAVVSKHLRSARVAIGVGGRYEQPGDASRSWEEALHALEVRRRSRNPDGVTVWDDLGVYRILTAGKDDQHVDTFVREWLGTLLDYDAEHETELVRTLAVYLESGGNYDETAEQLLVHRSTLRYRLKRIRQITGLRVNEADNRLNLHLATRAWALLEEPP